MTPFWPTFWISELNPDTRHHFWDFRFSKISIFQKCRKIDQKIFFRKSGFFGGRCAKMEKSIWASHPGFSSPQIGLENGPKTSLTPSGKFRAFGLKKTQNRFLSKNYPTKKKCLAKVLKIFLRTLQNTPKTMQKTEVKIFFRNPLFSPKFFFRKSKISKVILGVWVEFGNPKSGSKWGHFWDWTHWKNGLKAKILPIFM